MKILQLTRQFLPAQGGIEHVVEGLSVALQKSGHTVQVATLRSLFATGEKAPPQSVEAGVAVRRMRHWGSRRYPVAPFALQAIAGFDVVHIHAIDFFVDYLGWLRLLHRVPLVVSTHGGFFHTDRSLAFKHWYFENVTRRSLGRVGAVVCVSQSDLALFSRIVPRDRIRMIENGAELGRFRLLKKCVDPGLVVGIARLAENKRIERVLEAMAALKHRYPQLRLDWVGADFAGLRASLERRVVSLGLEGRVRFRGEVSKGDLEDLLTRAQMFVSASSYEGFGLSTIEAMSAATVAIVTAVGAHADVIEHGVTGFLLPADAAGLAAQMESVLMMPAARAAEVGEAARAATARFSWMQVAPRYEQVYREVLAAERHLA